MRLIIYFLCVNWISNIYGENIQQGQFPFPPQYFMSNPFISTDSTIYLPREFQTAAPHLLTNINNNLNKNPPQEPVVNIYPSSTVNYADINNLHRGERIVKHNLLPGIPLSSNQTNKQIYQEAERRNFMTMPQAINNKQNIDRMDTKITQFSTPKETTKAPPINPNPMPRGVIISADINKNQDFEQKAYYNNIHYAAPSSHIIVQSTTEPAIPILRLSNEMDLDGSFSYEALGADQTHYVQHSRMENIGTDKEGQIVEGSYSYVGDDGQTYTVNYIADSNGYRATGDHLPVAPPIPEIIQRSIQYNLAEEAKRPPNYQSFDEGEYDISIHNEHSSNYDKINQNYYTTPRSLFTGRTPEAFSMGLPHGTNLQNNLTPMASSKEITKTNVQFSDDKTKRNNNYGPLEPQITFLASQGAQVPLQNPIQKSPMPQLINYESRINELEHGNNKGLWRWQYGVNNKTVTDIPTKDSISRSSGEGEDIIINFSDMTPEEYTKVIRKQLYKDIHANLNNNDYQQPPEKNYNYNKNYLINDFKESNISYGSDNQIKHAFDNSDKTSDFTSENSIIYTSSENPYDSFNENYKGFGIQAEDIVNRDKFVKEVNYYQGASSTENTQWIDQNHQSNRVGNLKRTIITDHDTIHQNNYLNYDYNYNSNPPRNLYSPVHSFVETQNLLSSTPIPIQHNYLIQHKEIKEPLIYRETPNKQENLVQNKEKDLTTSEPDIKDSVRQNIFLRNLFIPKIHKSPNEELKKNPPKENNSKTMSNALPKSYNETKSYNQIKNVEKKPLDVSDVLNYIVNRNLFESNRLKTKNQSPPYKPLTLLNNLSQKPEPNSDDRIDNSKSKENKEDIRVAYNNFKQNPPQELRGNIKNYKVLLRNNARNSNIEAEGQSQPMSGLQNKSTYVKYPPLGRAGPSVKSYLPPIYL